MYVIYVCKMTRPLLKTFYTCVHLGGGVSFISCKGSGVFHQNMEKGKKEVDVCIGSIDN